MVPPALIGLLAGLFVRNVPSLKRTMGQPVLGVKQHRPKLAFMISYVLLVGGLIAAPIYVTIKYGDPMASFILAFVICGPLVIPFVNHCHAFYIQQTVSGVYWRNWRWKIRYMPYESISEVLLQSNGKNGYLRVRSRNIRRVRLSFDPGQFDGTVIFGHILYKVRTGEWASSVQQLSEPGFLEGRESFEALREIRFVRNLQASAPYTA